MSGLTIGPFWGVRVRIHASWVIILALVMATAAAQVADIDPTTSAGIQWGIGALIAIAFLVSAAAHEVAHAWVARRRGVAVDEIVIYFLGTAASTDLTTAKPRDEIAVAAAGPVLSLVIGAALLVLSFVTEGAGLDSVARIAFVIAVLNIVLGGFNLLPAFPLDGGRIVRAIGWARSGDPSQGLHLAARSGRMLGLIVAGISIFAILLTETVDALMIALCGWFLISTARAVERGAGLDRLLEGLLVSDVMEHDPTTVAPTLTIDTFGGQVLDGSSAMALLVSQGGQFLGLIGARQIRGLRRDRWATTRASDLMVSPPRLPIVAPGTSLRSALEGLTRARLDGLPVMDGGTLTGVVTRKGVAEAVQARALRDGVPM